MSAWLLHSRTEEADKDLNVLVAARVYVANTFTQPRNLQTPRVARNHARNLAARPPRNLHGIEGFVTNYVYARNLQVHVVHVVTRVVCQTPAHLICNIGPSTT